MSDTMFFVILLIFSSLFGTTIGAYYCTLEYRIRTNLPIVTADCICPSCRHRLLLSHQIPILSFFILKGKCHFCHTPIPIRYPIIEALFLIYYSFTYCIFHKYPLIYLSLWYLLVIFLLFTRCRKTSLTFVKGLLIMTFYHLVVGLLYTVIYLASYGSLHII